MNRYKLEVWEYKEANPPRKHPVIIDMESNLLVCKMECDEGNDNPYTFPFEVAKRRAEWMVEAMNAGGTL